MIGPDPTELSRAGLLRGPCPGYLASMVEYVGGPLSREKLAELVLTRGYPPGSLSVFGAHLDDAVVIDRRSAGWVVFYSERGSEGSLVMHATEDAACRDALDRVARFYPRHA